jgi:hypothetical protein
MLLGRNVYNEGDTLNTVPLPSTCAEANGAMMPSPNTKNRLANNRFLFIFLPSPFCEADLGDPACLDWLENPS